MRVATYYNNNDIRLEDHPVPAIREGELLIKVRAAGICGSDVTEWYRTGKRGRILGHEIAGEIAEVGPGLPQYKVGDRVAASHHVPCYECHFCHLGHHTLCDTLKKTNFDPGGFAEWIRLPAINVRHGVYPLGKGISFEEGVFTEPLACTVRAQRKANVRPGQTVLVIGAGAAGLLHLLTARARKAERVFASDINPFRLEAALNCGADRAFNGAPGLEEKLRAANEGRLADVVIVCAASEKATLASLKLVDRGGTVLFFALNGPDQTIPLPMNEIFWQKGAILMNSYAASPEDHHEALDLLRTRAVRVDHLISHVLPFGEIGKGFELVAKADNSLKILVDPTR